MADMDKMGLWPILTFWDYGQYGHYGMTANMDIMGLGQLWTYAVADGHCRQRAVSQLRSISSWNESPVSTASSTIAVPPSSRQSAGTTCSAFFSPVQRQIPTL